METMLEGMATGSSTSPRTATKLFPWTIPDLERVKELPSGSGALLLMGSTLSLVS